MIKGNGSNWPDIAPKALKSQAKGMKSRASDDFHCNCHKTY